MRGKIGLKVFFVLAMFIPFAVLLLFSLAYMGVFAKALIQNPSSLLPLMLLGLVIGAVWLIWILGSSWIKRLLFGEDTKQKQK